MAVFGVLGGDRRQLYLARSLEEDGIVQRKVYPQVPPRVEYSLTDRGRSLLPILHAMRDWGTAYLREQDLEPNCSMAGTMCCCEKNV